ncbi:MAG: nitrate- and nitrite sensing domain-containing protein, partial [Candidatus Margulisiibacteriota bacterium]
QSQFKRVYQTFKNNPSILTEQRDNVDDNTDVVKERLDLCKMELSAKALEQNSQLSALRDSVSNSSILPKVSAAKYTEIIYEYFRIIKEDITPTIQDPRIKAGLVSHMYLMLGKDFCGRERATISGILNVNKPIDADSLKVLNKLIDEQASNLDDKFVNSTEADLKDMYFEIKQDKNYSAALEVRKTVLAKANTGDFGITTPEWWAAKTVVMNLLKKLDEKSLQKLLAIVKN